MGAQQARKVPFPKEQSSLGSLIRYRGNPLLRFEDMQRRYGGVVGFNVVGSSVVVVLDPIVVHEVLVRQNELFEKDSYTAELRVVLGRGLLTDEGEHHKRQRRLVAPSLQPLEVEEYARVMAERTKGFAATLRDGQIVDVRSAMMRLTLDLLVHTLFGHHFDDYPVVEQELDRVMRAFRPWAELSRRITPEWLPLPSRRRIRIARERLHAVVDHLIADKRRAGSGRDLLTRLIHETDEAGGMTDEDLRDQVITLFLAGHETTALTLAYLLRLLALNPEARQRVEAELDALSEEAALDSERLRNLSYTHAVFKESLRLYPPAWVIGRRALQRCAAAGWEIAEGQELFIPVYTIQRDPRWFDEPERFLPERFLPGGEVSQAGFPRFAYAPFGGGARVCVGGHFAQVEAMMVLSTLLRRFRFDWVKHARFDIAPSITLRPKYPMPMQVWRR